MPCLNLDVDYFKHPRTLRLRARLGAGAELLPLELWCHCARYHPETGRLEGYTPAEVESACGWGGERGKAALALEETGFLAVEGGAYAVPGWLEEQGHIAAFKKRARAAALKRWGDIPKAARSSPECAPDDAPHTALGNASGIAFSNAPTVPDQQTRPSVVSKSMGGNCENKSMGQFSGPPLESAQKQAFRVRGFAGEESGRPQKPDAPQCQARADRLKLVACYKSFRGIKSGAGWEARNLERNCRAADSLLGAFGGNLEAAARWLCAFGERMDSRGLCWTLDTAARHAWDSAGPAPRGGQ